MSRTSHFGVNDEPVVVVGSNPKWADEFNEIATRIRVTLGSAALRIDHIESTAVSGLDAKPVIDIQVSVLDLEPADSYLKPLQSLGFVFQEDNPDKTKRFFRESPYGRRIHVHVRRHGSYDEQLNLLFRDYLRIHKESAAEYTTTKRELAEKFTTDREGYVKAKEPIVWSLLTRAHQWAQEVGWTPGPTDA